MAEPTERDLALTRDEKIAIAALKRLARIWPKTLMLFGGGGWQLSVRKRPPRGTLYGPDWEVVSIHGIFNDGGDGGDRT